MSRQHLMQSAKALLAVAVCGLSLSSCADAARTGSGPAYLIIQSVTGASGGGSPTFGTSLRSDVQVLVDVVVGGTTVQQATVYNDLGRASLRAELKNSLNPTAPTALNSVTITRYRVRYRRSDGRNTEGVDVPYGFDGAVTVNIGIGSTANVDFDLVRHQAKLERPLSTMAGVRGLIFLSTIAEVTFYGHDQAGNELSITGAIDVSFGDFGDS